MNSYSAKTLPKRACICCVCLYVLSSEGMCGGKKFCGGEREMSGADWLIWFPHGRANSPDWDGMRMLSLSSKALRACYAPDKKLPRFSPLYVCHHGDAKVAIKRAKNNICLKI